MSRKMIDLIGKKFGELTVVSYYGQLKPDSKKDKKNAWICICSCGNRSIVRSSVLNCKKHVNSCFECARKNNGLKYSNLTGMKFGRLLVLSKAKKPNVKNGSQYWNVICDCGITKIVSTNPLKKGTTVSCGCYNKENASKLFTTHGLSANWAIYNKFRRKNPFEKLKHAIGCQVRSAFKDLKSIKNGSVWNFLPYTPEELRSHFESLWEPWMTWENYGGTSDNKTKTWWIDHIKPQCSFYFKSMDDLAFKECWSLDNLRPLEKIENMSKNKKML